MSESGAKFLVNVNAPHFCAALIMRDDTCVEAAPILHWAIGWSGDELRVYFAMKKWLASIRPLRG